MMRESINFSFNGISSEDMGVSAIQTGGLFEENFLPKRTIIESNVASKDKPSFQRVKNEPIAFPLTIFIENWKERDSIRPLAKWLFTNEYKPLYFESNPDRLYYAIVEGDSNVFHNGKKEGYVTLNIRCNSPYTFSNPLIHENIESSVGQYSINNSGDMGVVTKLWITKTVSNGDINITIEETNQSVTLSDLELGEEVYLDGDNEEIISSLSIVGIHRYDNHNGQWLNLNEGINSFLLYGDFTFSIEYQTIYLAD